MTAAEIFEYARRHADGRGFRFGPGVAADFRSAAARAHRDIANPSKSYTDADAKKAFREMIAEMILVRDEIPGYADRHPGEIGEETLRRAEAKKCPFWPFC